MLFLWQIVILCKIFYMEKKEFVLRTAVRLFNNHKKMDGIHLAELLNSKGFLTNYGTTYVGTRGIYKLISATYHWLDNAGRESEANIIAKAFVKPNGDYAYN